MNMFNLFINISVHYKRTDSISHLPLAGLLQTNRHPVSISDKTNDNFLSVTYPLSPTCYLIHSNHSSYARLNAIYSSDEDAWGGGSDTLREHLQVTGKPRTKGNQWHGWMNERMNKGKLRPTPTWKIQSNGGRGRWQSLPLWPLNPPVIRLVQNTT